MFGNNSFAASATNKAVADTTARMRDGVWWKGVDGHIYVRAAGVNGVVDYGPNGNVVAQSMYKQIADPNPQQPSSNTGTTGGGGAASTYGTGSGTAKQLDQVQIDSLNSLLSGYDANREDMKKKAQLARDAYLKEKQDELNTEKGKYDNKKLETLQDYGSARTKNDVNTRDTLKNLISSLAVLGMGGGKELSRQVLSASNRSNREANATQAKNNQQLDTAFNDYSAGNENDIKKINDQYGESVSKADQTWAQNRQNALYKIADVYNAADVKDQRQRYMQEGDGLNSFISNSAFLTPSYTGAKRQMATPDLASYSQAVPQYQTTLGNTMTPVGNSVPGNVSVKAIAVNDKDFGVKPKQEGNLGYGV